MIQQPGHTLRQKLLQTDTYPTFYGIIHNGKTCKQAKCPSTEEWIRKLSVHISMVHYPAIKKINIPSCSSIEWTQILLY